MTDLLTPAEYRVLRLRADGLPVKAVAAECGVSTETVKHQVASIFERLQVDNITSAYRAVGWLRPPGADLPLEDRCPYIAQCGRRPLHRGQHGGFK